MEYNAFVYRIPGTRFTGRGIYPIAGGAAELPAPSAGPRHGRPPELLTHIRVRETRRGARNEYFHSEA